jgi:hypothetical protein
LIANKEISMKNFTQTAQALLALSATALLVACGGGGGGGGTTPPADPPVAGTDVPTSATTSSAAATEFVRTVVAKGEANAETELIVGNVVLATSETDDPAAI